MIPLTIDVGNSTIGIGRWEGEAVAVTSFDDPEEAAAAVDGPAVALSVSPDGLRELLSALDPGVATGVRILREPPLPLADARLATTAGADRIAAALALLPGPGIAVDAGTAVTVDVVDADGVYRGGFIAAGPAVAARGLSLSTAQLPTLSGEPAALIPGVETSSAMAAGTWGMAVGGTDRLVEAALATLPAEPAPRLVATGAWGAAWAAASRYPSVEVDVVLVHRGMRAWAAAP